MKILREDYFEKRCEKRKWNNMFWEESGCARFNAGELCKFEEAKSEVRELPKV